MRNSVKPAPTSIPPTAMGRTIEYHMLKASPLQFMVVPGGRLAWMPGPRK